jgi:hypothetical protein
MANRWHQLAAFGGEERENQTSRGVELIIFLELVNLLIRYGLFR